MIILYKVYTSKPSYFFDFKDAKKYADEYYRQTGILVAVERSMLVYSVYKEPSNKGKQP